MKKRSSGRGAFLYGVAMMNVTCLCVLLSEAEHSIRCSLLSLFGQICFLIVRR